MHQKPILAKDYDALSSKIQDLVKKKREVGKSMGEACGQGAETFHDNAPYEMAMAEFELLSKQIGELQHIYRHAVIIHPKPNSSSVSIGSRVDVHDVELNKSTWYEIRGAWFSQEGNPEGKVEDYPVPVSYHSPLGKALMGEKPFAEVKIKVEDHSKKYLILEIL